MSFTEFTYQLVQGFDFLWLYEHKNVKLQMGGSDQWGNIITGTELIRRKTGGEVFAFTCPLIKKADGGKFGKTEKGNIWLDLNKTSSYEFLQFWFNASDSDAETWVRIFTFLPEEVIDALIDRHKQNPEARELQKVLAREVTLFVHGENEYKKAIDTTEKIFSDQTAAATSLSKSDLESLTGIINLNYPIGEIKNGKDIVAFLSETGIFSSKGEARKMIQNGGVSINRDKVNDISQLIDSSSLLHDEYLLVQKGKKNHYLVKIN
jgi:tyrosyl-tRNA synthetase